MFPNGKEAFQSAKGRWSMAEDNANSWPMLQSTISHPNGYARDSRADILDFVVLGLVFIAFLLN